jgi:3-methyladenine DNA glycosylase AlkD
MHPACYHELFALMEKNKDPERAKHMAAYMKDNFPFLGIPKSILTPLIKPFLKLASQDAAVDYAFVRQCWRKEYREAQYVGVEYLLILNRTCAAADLNFIKELITTKSWWDVTDSLDQLVGMLAERFPTVKSEMIIWSKSENIWLRRVAINHQLRYKSKTDTELLQAIIINNLGLAEFFINKAIGWSLREYSKTNPSWVSQFIARYRTMLAPLSIREAEKYL